MTFINCPKCNSEVPDGSKFCNHCGHKFEQENTIKCPNPECGHSIPADSKFCPDCGTKIIKQKASSADWKYYYPYVDGKDQYDCPLIGYKDIRNGKIIAKAQYIFAYYFHDGLAVVGSGHKPTKYGYIDESGNLKISMMYDHANEFSEGLAWVKIDDEWWCINTDGDRLFTFPLDEGESLRYNGPGKFKEGKSTAFILINDRFESSIEIDKSGRIVENCDSSSRKIFQDGTYIFSENGKEGIKDADGSIIISAEYNHILRLNHDFFEINNDEEIDDYPYTWFNYKRGIVNSHGKVILHCSDQECAIICSNRILVKNHEIGKIFISDSEGAIVKTFPQNLNPHVIGENVLVVEDTQTQLFGLADSDGKIIIMPQFNEIEDIDICDAGRFFAVLKDGLYGVIHASGKLIAPCRFVNKPMAIDGIIEFENDDDFRNPWKFDFWGPIK